MALNNSVLHPALAMLVKKGKLTASAAKFLQFQVIDKRMREKELVTLLTYTNPEQLKTLINRLRAKRMKLGAVMKRARKAKGSRLRTRPLP